MMATSKVFASRWGMNAAISLEPPCPVRLLKAMCHSVYGQIVERTKTSMTDIDCAPINGIKYAVQ